MNARGSLVRNAIDTFNCNGKFFVFTSENDINQIYKSFNDSCIQNVGDIVVFPSFQENEILMVTSMLIERLKNMCKRYLKIELETDDDFKLQIMSNFNNKTGIEGLENYIQKEIYKPLSEYCLKNPSYSYKKVSITYEESFIVIFEDKRVVLSEFVKDNTKYEIEEVKKELGNIIGLNKVKDFVLNIENNLEVQKLREAKGLKNSGISMHMIFSGNPGTGKTTIARIVARYLKAIGVLSSGHLKEVTRADLVGQYVGQTAQLTNDIIKSSIGGVLFIDEAYSICRNENDSYGIEAIDTLVKGIEDNRENLIVILAGYENEMEEFLKMNPGLKSRIPNVVEFEDYTAEEMYEIAKITAKNKAL